MIIEYSVLDTEAYTIEHISNSQENLQQIEKFKVGKDAQELEEYLKKYAFEDEQSNNSRAYLVKDKSTGELVSYFSLRTQY